MLYICLNLQIYFYNFTKNNIWFKQYLFNNTLINRATPYVKIAVKKHLKGILSNYDKNTHV